MLRSLLALIALLLSLTAHASESTLLQPARTLDQYRTLSDALEKLDTSHRQRELTKADLEQPLPAERTSRFGFDPDQGEEFYRSEAGKQVAESILSYQTPSGGWSKRTLMGHAPRPLGGAYGAESNYIPTFDNDATSTQFWELVSAYHATTDKRYAEAANRALQLILLAQYPNGGWPQSFPLRGGYHDAITFNDELIPNLLDIVAAVASGDERLNFLDAMLITQAEDSLQRALQLVVNTQVVIDSVPTIWGAQHDPASLAPIKARAYEPAALATSESAELLRVLMKLEQPPAAIKTAIVNAHNWFAHHRIDGYSWEPGDKGYNELMANANAGPLWARFYSLDKQKPVFSDRDGSVYASVDKVSVERRRGYGWYTEKPSRILKSFNNWQQQHIPETQAP
ncbi:MAG TPA: pectate lyase [Cellvibrionaceae bacterium]